VVVVVDMLVVVKVGFVEGRCKGAIVESVVRFSGRVEVVVAVQLGIVVVVVKVEGIC
jgi:hypothetical protein